MNSLKKIILFSFCISFIIFSCTNKNIKSDENIATDENWSKCSPITNWDQMREIAGYIRMGVSKDTIISLYGEPHLLFDNSSLIYLKCPDCFGMIKSITFEFEGGKLIYVDFGEISRDPW